MLKLYSKPNEVNYKEEDLAAILDNPIHINFNKDKVIESFNFTKDYLNEAFVSPEKESRLRTLSIPKSTHHCGAGLFEKVGISPGVEFLPTDNLDRFEKLLNSITIYTDIEDDKNKNYRIVKGILPTNYFALVDHVKLKHLPDEFFEYVDLKGKIVEGSNFQYRLDSYAVKNSEGSFEKINYKFNIYCDEASPLPTNVIWPGVSKDAIIENYHCITIKIHRNGVIKSWDVGNELEDYVPADPANQYVKLGKFGKHKCIK